MNTKNIFFNIDQLTYHTLLLDKQLLFLGLGVSNPIYSFSFQNWIQGLELTANYQVQESPTSTSLFNLSFYSQYQISKIFDLKINLGIMAMASSDINFPQNHFGTFLQMNFGTQF
jgi:hypothetical protein